MELRDGGSRYKGKGVLTACKNVNDIIGPALIGMNPADQVRQIACEVKFCIDFFAEKN